MNCQTRWVSGESRVSDSDSDSSPDDGSIMPVPIVHKAASALHGNRKPPIRLLQDRITTRDPRAFTTRGAIVLISLHSMLDVTEMKRLRTATLRVRAARGNTIRLLLLLLRAQKPSPRPSHSIQRVLMSRLVQVWLHFKSKFRIEVD